MVILSGCENPFNSDNSTRSCIRDYTAKVEVRMENGDPCVASFVILTSQNPHYIKYCNDDGDVFIRITEFFTGIKGLNGFTCDNLPMYQHHLVNIFMDKNDPPVLIESEISLKIGNSYPISTMVFPDSLARRTP